MTSSARLTLPGQISADIQRYVQVQSLSFQTVKLLTPVLGGLVLMFSVIESTVYIVLSIEQ